MSGISEKINSLKLDIAELEALEAQATRQKVKDILFLEGRKLTAELTKLQEEVINSPKPTEASSGACAVNKHYEIKLTNYAWDQSDKYVKFYVNVPKVNTIPPENVTCMFKERSFELKIKNLENKDYSFTINHLLYPIKPEESNWKVKTDMVLINCAKSVPQNWDYVTELEKKTKDKKFDFDGDNKMDPGEGLMSIMKNMYEKGDDEMKRTIAKAWTESQMKGPNFNP